MRSTMCSEDRSRRIEADVASWCTKGKSLGDQCQTTEDGATSAAGAIIYPEDMLLSVDGEGRGEYC